MIGTLMAIYATYKNLNFAGESKNMVYFGFFHQCAPARPPPHMPRRSVTPRACAGW